MGARCGLFLLATLLGSALPLLSATPTFAQALSACTTTACVNAQISDHENLLSTFPTLLGTAEGVTLLNSNLATVVDIYQNATYAQRNLAVINDNLTNVQTNIWGMVSTPLATAMQSITAGNGAASTQVNTIFNVQLSTLQIEPVKNFFAAQQTYKTAYGYTGTDSGDPRPFLTSPAIANNPWQPGQASPTAIAGQQEQWQVLATEGAFPSGHSSIGNSTALLYAVLLPEAYQDLLQSAVEFGRSRNILGVHYPLDIIGGRIMAYENMAKMLANDPNYVAGDFAASIQQASQTLHTELGATVAVPYAACASNISSCVGNGVFPTAAQFATNLSTYAANLTYGLPSVGSTTSAAVVPANAELLIASRFPYLTALQRREILATTELPSGVPLDDGSGWARLNLYAATSGYGAFNTDVSVTLDAALGGYNAIDVWSNAITGSAGLSKFGTGVLVLGGANSYTGATRVKGGVLALTGSMTSSVEVDAGAQFIAGGPVTGNIANAGRLSGTGSVTGNVVNAGTWAPGNSIGTQNVTGNVTFNAGSVFEVEVNGVGAGDRVNATGTATLNGGTVSVLALPGPYNPATTYTIVSAAGGVTGAFTNATANLPFLTPSLAYTATDVNLTMTRNANAFASVATSGNQRAVAVALDRASSGGQIPTVVNAVTGLTASQADDAYAQMSGEAYSDVGSVSIFAGQMFMGTLNQQIAQARGGGGTASSGTRVNLASLGAPKFGDAETGVSAGSAAHGPWNAWMSGVGVTGKVDGNGNSSTLNYSGGGGGMGIDKQVDPDVILGIAAGYANTNVSSQGVSSSGTVNSYQGAFYGSYNPSALYVQGLAGYAYNDSTMTRTINFGTINSTANGSTSSNQFFGAFETGYAFPVAKATSLTPFLGLQATTANQAAFTETGAGELDLTVDSQTTNSVRSILGFQVDYAADLGFLGPMAFLARAGWAHEYADTARTVTASFAGAPGSGFTVDGAQMARNSAVLAVGATAKLTQALSFLLRYDGDVNGSDNAHAITGRLSLTW